MDYIQIFHTFVGSFFGFGFALLTQFILTQITKSINSKKVKVNLNDELKHIYDGYYDKESNQVKNGRIYFSTPIWDSVISTGDILVIIKQDKDYYDKVVSVYCILKTIDKLEAENNPNYKDLIYESKQYVIERIRNTLNIN
ncbi:MAG: hypothetical protein FWE05_00790 [Defluviitaleaceae bacterium]|nr:hypothetical protein [Defluviitaleaceae bacterium]